MGGDAVKTDSGLMREVLWVGLSQGNEQLGIQGSGLSGSVFGLPD